jgi:hypothetical protein
MVTSPQVLGCRLACPDPAARRFDQAGRRQIRPPPTNSPRRWTFSAHL